LKITAIIGVLASIKISQWMLRSVIFIFVLLFVGVVQAQIFPSKPIKVIVTHSPSRCLDLITRGVEQKLGGFCGQPDEIDVEKVKYGKLIKDNHIKAG